MSYLSPLLQTGQVAARLDCPLSDYLTRVRLVIGKGVEVGLGLGIRCQNNDVRKKVVW